VHLITSSSYREQPGDGRVGATARVLPPSELSDGTSVASDEGSRVDTRKKPVKSAGDFFLPTPSQLIRGWALPPGGESGVYSSGEVVLPPSELSDGTSVASDEGSRVDTRKKPVKVSFDDIRRQGGSSWVFQCRFHGRY
jgi:hypothetical protein